MSLAPFLFAADLDGTLLPNTGKQPVAGCLERTQDLLAWLLDGNCPVCFISGRYLTLAKKAQKTFRFPPPTWWVCNVGTEIYNSQGVRDERWFQLLGPAFDHEAMQSALYKIRRLSLQELAKQGPHKFSLYYPEPNEVIQTEILSRLAPLGYQLRLVYSVEEATGRALIDVIPKQAGKALALRYLADKYSFENGRVFFAGDSGNDLDALISGICGTLVGNAPESVRRQARRLQEQMPDARLYFAQAYFGDGIIEGLQFFKLILDGSDSSSATSE